MRPQPGGDVHSSSFPAKPRSRKSSVDLHVPTTFVMKRVEDLGHASGTPQIPTSASRKRASTYGVQNLADTLEAAFGVDATTKTTEAASHDVGNQKKGIARSGSHSSSAESLPPADSLNDPPSRKSKRKLSGHVVPTPPMPSAFEAPVTVPTSAMSSTPRSVSMVSLKLSDEESALEDSASQAIISSGDEEEEDTATQQGASESFPELVMPSIQMPTRRPFTTKGKAMGKLKVMVAGRTGIGKSSLIRSIVQVCEHIVHVDPLTATHPVLRRSPPKSKARRKRTEHQGTTRIMECHASTKPYPPWWNEAEAVGPLRRRKSSLDSAIERNICFVDTPGFSEGPSEDDDIDLLADYVESMLYQTASLSTLDDNDVLGVVSGSGGVSVDVILYLLPPDKDLTKDIEVMQRLSTLTNVMPLIARSDTLSARDTIALKTSILARLQATSVRPFFFGKPLDDALLAVQGLPLPPVDANEVDSESPQYSFTKPTYPYSISSTLGSDSEIMDASLLMSPDYIQPLLPSELPALVNQIFDPDSIAWLRHSAAKRFLAWRKIKRCGDMSIPQGVPRPHSPTTASIGLNTAITTSAGSSLFSAASPSGVLVPRSSSPYYSSNLQSPFLASPPSLALSEPHDVPTNFSLTRWTNQPQVAHHPSELRIAKWATDLQRSLRNERDRYEELQREDRAKWLLERVGEEVSKGTIVASSDGGPPLADWAVVKCGKEKANDNLQPGQRHARLGGLDSRDPLGLCEFTDECRRRGFVLVKVLGGVSVLGALVVAVVRVCDVDVGMARDGWWGWIVGGGD